MIETTVAPAVSSPPQEFRLRDGRRVLVRPIEPDDRERLQVGLHQLSPSRAIIASTPPCRSSRLSSCASSPRSIR